MARPENPAPTIRTCSMGRAHSSPAGRGRELTLMLRRDTAEGEHLGPAGLHRDDERRRELERPALEEIEDALPRHDRGIGLVAGAERQEALRGLAVHAVFG